MTDPIYTLFCTLGDRLYASKIAPLPGGRGYGLHEGFVLHCPGNTDDDGTVSDRHVVGMLARDPANPNPDVQYRILNQPQYDAHGKVVGDSDAGWISSAVFHFVDPDGNPTGQDAIDSANPVCTVCGKPISI